MSALRLAKGSGGGRPPTRTGAPATQGLVLPKLLRRPARWFGRLFGGEVHAPRHATTMLHTALLAPTIIYGIAIGGHTPEVMQAVTSRTGFAVDQVKVIGNRETSEIDVLDRLELDGWTSLVGMNASNARARIAGLPWISSVSVRKTYPDMLEVKIEEREPFAIWQRNGELNVVERNGSVIAPFRGEASLARLPLVVGEGAAGNVDQLVREVARHPNLADRARVFVRVADRRWDVKFDTGVTVKLPEFEAGHALARLAAMEAESAILEKDVVALDMRLPDRLMVQMTQEAVEQRAAELKAKMKPGKRT